MYEVVKFDRVLEDVVNIVYDVEYIEREDLDMDNCDD